MINSTKTRTIKKAISPRIYSCAFILLLAMTLLMSFAQPGFAQVGIPQPEKTVGYITVAPTLVGVDQKATVNLWIFPLPDNYFYMASYNGFNGITVTFTKPDGSEDRNGRYR